MQWTDEALVLGLRRQGETSVILELMTRNHGRHLGLVHGGRSRRMQPVLQAGNRVQATWRARLDESLGAFVVEPIESVAARLMGSGLALYGMSHLAGLLRLLPERDPHPELFAAAGLLVAHLDDPDIAPPLMVRFELALLAELGFYVSPRSGRAVSASAGEPYRDKLLALPDFLRERVPGAGLPMTPDARDVTEGFTLTGYFLDQHIWGPRAIPVPEERTRFVALGTGNA
jgi:DNA repair protein RecO (recombination protein O)